MIQVWKCDYCSTTDVDYKKIQHHEPTCSFNKLNKITIHLSVKTREIVQVGFMNI